ncbi:AraC family transcriptional regulator [Formosa sp. S-31]|uniref:AraC family transcriptional regulator n=1 Tax=Formosa sp. S-31 TaxID=2790949 RepID=UPI003EBAA883
MERYKQFNSLVVADLETDIWNHPLHNHNHFEIIYIMKGSGVHQLNGLSMPYKKGHLYVLGPEDEHEFQIEKRTRFIYVKFTNFYLDTKDVDNPGEWNRTIDAILKSRNCKNGNILKLNNDIKHVNLLMTLIADEYEKTDLLGRRIIFQHFKALVLIIKRNLDCDGNISERKPQANSTEALLEYIALHIYQPKFLTKQRIAEAFHLSPNYIGIYFKDKVGTSLKEYIQEYRFSLLEQRLKNGQRSSKQLVLDFGFTDESHLHKFVKRQSGKSLMELKAELD